jgi:hypothetical protein
MTEQEMKKQAGGRHVEGLVMKFTIGEQGQDIVIDSRLFGYCSPKGDSGHSLELVDLNDEYPPHLEITCTATSRREPKAEQFGGWCGSHSEVLPCKPPSTGKINAPYECQGSRCLTSTKCGVKDSPESKLEGVGTFVYAG